MAPVLNMLSGSQLMNTLVHAAADRQHLRRVRQRRARARAAGVRRDDRRDDHARDAVAPLRVQVPAGRSSAPPLLDEPLPLPARLAALVRGHGEPARVPVGACTSSGSCWPPIRARSACSPTIPFTACRRATSASISTATRSRRSAARSGGSARASARGFRRSARDDVDLHELSATAKVG